MYGVVQRQCRYRKNAPPMKPHDTIPWIAYPDMSVEERIAATKDFYDSIKTRRTCRFIGGGPLAREAIETAIMAAGTAPSGANHQPWHFALVTSPEARHRIRIAAEEEERIFYSGKAGKEWLEALAPLGTDDDKAYLDAAPLIIAVFGQRKGGLYPGEMRQNYYMHESVGIACGFLLAALHAAKFATLTHTPNPMNFLNEICGRPANEKPVMLIVVGHAEADASIPVHATIKKPFDQIASWI
jgi:nitroreductase